MYNIDYIIYRGEEYIGLFLLIWVKSDLHIDLIAILYDLGEYELYIGFFLNDVCLMTISSENGN